MKHHAIGIDLGTTYCAVATIDEFGKPKMLLNREGSTLTPSVVQLDASGNAIVGEAAKNSFAFEPESTSMFFKTHMGDPGWSSKISGRKYDATQLSAYVLRRLKEDAETELRSQIRKVVITVPAYFNDAQRVATRQSAEIAGLEVLQLINEPTAAAIDYGRETANARENRNVFVFDLGGGTLDATVLRIEGDEFRVLQTDGLHELGGILWDQLIVDVIREKFQSEHGLDISSDASAVADAIGRAETAKRTLSQRDEATVQVAASGARVSFKMSRADFEARARYLMEQCSQLVRGVLKEARKSKTTIDEVLLVGGSTRMPMIREMIVAECGLDPVQSSRVDENVARGAAYVAYQLLREGGIAPVGIAVPDILKVTDVSTHSLGVILTRLPERVQYNNIIIKRFSALPASVSEDLGTIENGQTAVRITVTEGESDRPDDCAELGEVDLPIPIGQLAGYRVNIQYEYNTSGVLRVTATDPATAIRREIEIHSPLRKTEEEVQTASSQLALLRVE